MRNIVILFIGAFVFAGVEFVAQAQEADRISDYARALGNPDISVGTRDGKLQMATRQLERYTIDKGTKVEANDDSFMATTSTDNDGTSVMYKGRKDANGKLEFSRYLFGSGALEMAIRCYAPIKEQPKGIFGQLIDSFSDIEYDCVYAARDTCSSLKRQMNAKKTLIESGNASRLDLLHILPFETENYDDRVRRNTTKLGGFAKNEFGSGDEFWGFNSKTVKKRKLDAAAIKGLMSKMKDLCTEFFPDKRAFQVPRSGRSSGIGR